MKTRVTTRVVMTSAMRMTVKTRRRHRGRTRRLGQEEEEAQERQVKRRVSSLYRSWCVRAPRSKMDTSEWGLAMALDDLNMVALKQIEQMQTGSEGAERWLDEAVCELRKMAARMDEQDRQEQLGRGRCESRARTGAGARAVAAAAANRRTDAGAPTTEEAGNPREKRRAVAEEQA
jgi:hypothetical protein